MIRTDLKEISAKVQNHLIRLKGGKKALYESIKNYSKRYKKYNERGIEEYAIAEMVEGGKFLISNKDIFNFLHRLGYSRAELEKMDIWKRYKDLVSYHGYKFYRQYEKELELKKRK